MRFGGKIGFLTLGVVTLLLAAGGISVFLLQARQSTPTYGATFSSMYAEQLGVDWREAYVAILDDLGVDALRVPVYWSEVEPSPGVLLFDDLDWMMNEAAGRGVEVTLVVGQKVPRWPECFTPDWAEAVSSRDRANAQLAFVKTTVERYKHHPALHRWQVENESFFPFGVCPAPDPIVIEREILTVRTYDPDHAIQLTTSGEQAFWVFRAIPADVLGFSLYRVVQNEFFGVLIFPYRPEFYAIQRGLAGLFAKDVIVSELQVEPWGIGNERIGYGYGVEEAYRLFTEEDVRYHMDFARRTGASEVFLWGVEWWYYLREHGASQLWDTGRTLIEESHE